MTIAAVLFRQTSQWHGQDLHLYARAGRNVLAGMIPYRDFAFEYPPFALLPMAIPALFIEVSPDARSYLWPFLLSNAVWAILLAAVVSHVAREWLDRRAQVWTIANYAVLSFIGSPIFPWRFDLFPALLCGAAVLAALRNRPASAGVLLGLGIGTKVYPAAIASVICMWFVANGGGAMARRFLLCVVATPVALMLPFLALAPHDALSFMTYHASRGLQLESVPATFLMLAHHAGWLPLEVVENYGAMHLQWAHTRAVESWLLVVFIAAMGAVTIRARHRFRMAPRDPSQLVALATAALLLFMLTNRALSPQYLAWLLPFAPLLKRRQAVVAMAAFILTIVIFPYHYPALMNLRGGMVAVLCARNCLLIVLGAWLVVEPPLGPVDASPAVSAYSFTD